ncbi:MAG: hypothetical protein RJA36_805 [Pseudomonadota bacterium]
MAVLSLLKGSDTSELRKHCMQRRTHLIERRQPWLDFSRQIAEELIPNRLPYLQDPHGITRAGEHNTHICDAVGHLALETAAAGVASGSMPPTSPWFGLSIRNVWSDDDDLRLYLDESQQRMLGMHNQSNANHVLPELQKEWIAFGTAAALLLEDDEDGHRIDPMTVGEYCIADDARGRVDTIYRDFTMTVGQLADEFGPDALSTTARSAYERQDFDLPIPCVHAIEPDRDGRNPEGDNPDLPWRSVYFELTSGCDQVLAVRGFTRFPGLVWRMGKLPGSAYGYGRGQDALPHLIRLRKMIYRYGQAMAEMADPAVQIPAGLSAHEVRMLPGGKTSVFGQTPVTNLRQVTLRLAEMADAIERTRQDIRDTLGATLVASLRRVTHQMTAREADLRTSQDMTEWLPSLYRLSEELLNPYVEWLWEIGTQAGLLPTPPESLAGQVIDIEFTSPLARKQRQAEVDAIVRTFAIAGEMAKLPQLAHILDNLDVDTALRKIAEIEGAPTSVLVPVEAVQKLRAARAQQMQAQQQAAAAQQGVDIARSAADAQRLSA